MLAPNLLEWEELIGVYAEADLRTLNRHVSNVEADVYTIFNLPEEVIAVIFAKVSRSPLSFRDTLLQVIRDQEVAVDEMLSLYEDRGFAAATEQARQFHEKWVVGYGHASVAEHATAHVGVERISRLASALLELSNPFLSFTEYSQRYQRPQRGGFYLPPELSDPRSLRLRQRYVDANERAYEIYTRLQEALLPHLRQANARKERESERAYASRIAKVSFEDARYALSLAVHTNLGLTGNARAMRDALVRLYSDPYSETTRLADAIKTEVTKLLPALLKYGDPSPYRIETRQALAARVPALAGPPEPRPPLSAHKARHGGGSVAPVLLSDFTGNGTADPESAALDAVLSETLLEYSRLDGQAARARLAGMTQAEKVALYTELVRRRGPHDPPVDALKAVHYTVDLLISEANWHQLLRHCRRVDFVWGEPSIDAGITVPPTVANAGLTPMLEQAITAVEQAHRAVAQEFPLLAHYLVSNAHRRRVRARFDLSELYHLINLRAKPDAQWDIRFTVQEIVDEVRKVHPHLLVEALAASATAAD